MFNQNIHFVLSEGIKTVNKNNFVFRPTARPVEDVINYSWRSLAQDFTVCAFEQVESVYLVRFMTSFSTMDVHFAFGLIFILDLFSHGISGENAYNALHSSVQLIPLLSYFRLYSNKLPFFSSSNQFQWLLWKCPKSRYGKRFGLFFLKVSYFIFYPVLFDGLFTHDFDGIYDQVFLLINSAYSMLFYDIILGYQVTDDITDSYERYPRNVVPNQNFWDRKWTYLDVYKGCVIDDLAWNKLLGIAFGRRTKRDQICTRDYTIWRKN
jgi:hypothetical protein